MDENEYTAKIMKLYGRKFMDKMGRISDYFQKISGMKKYSNT